MEQITLNMIPKGITPMCHASQYDKGRHIRLNIMDGLQGYKLTDETAEIRVRKPDNNIVTAAGTYTAGTAYVDLFTTEQMTACEGDNECELRLTKGEQRIGSLNFKMRVEKDPLKDGIESESVIHNLEQQIEELVEEQYDADSVIFDDEPTEGHGTGYAVKSGGLKAYIPKAIGALDDVDIDSPAGNQALVWNPTTQKWENGEVSTVGSIDDLNDVDTSGKTAGDSLRFDPDAGEEGEWVAEPITIKMTTAEWEDIADKQAWRNEHKNTYLIITDAPNLNATAQDISYDGGTDTVWDKVEERLKVIEYHPTTNTVTITASAIGAVCEVFVNRGYNAYDASLQAITGGNQSNFQLVEVYKGSNVTVTKTSGTEFTITAGTELLSSTVYLLVISGEWTISG